jgi:hypothetical protein
MVTRGRLQGVAAVAARDRSCGEERGSTQVDSSALAQAPLVGRLLFSRWPPDLRKGEGCRRHGRFAAERRHDQPEKELSKPAAEEATMECSGSRGRKVRGWRPEVEQWCGRGERAIVKKGPPVDAVPPAERGRGEPRV